MCMARCSTVLVLIAVILLIAPSMVLASGIYLVNEGNWNVGFDSNAWAAQYTFYAGDCLIFHYDPNWHNVVVATDGDAYNNCVASPNLGTYSTGNDGLFLNDVGTYYFICQLHCGRDALKMKIQVLPLRQNSD